MKLINKVKGAVDWTASKSSAAFKLGAGITGDAVATVGAVTGGAIAITGGAVAVVGFATYAGGVAVMGASEKLAIKSQATAGKAYDDLVGKSETSHEAEVADFEVDPFGSPLAAR